MNKKRPIEAVQEIQCYFFEKCCPYELYDDLHHLWNAELANGTMTYSELMQEAEMLIDNYFKIIKLREDTPSKDLPF
jgi:hypothetical protein